VRRAWIVCAALAMGMHALLLFGIHPGTIARPRPIADEASAVELNIVESAPAAPSSTRIEQAPTSEQAAEPAQAPPEPITAPAPEPEMPKPIPAPQPRTETPAALTPNRPREASARPNAKPVRGSGPATGARPRYRSNPKPDYPLEARRAGQEGVVILTVQVTARGRVANVQVSRSSGFPLLDTAALQAVRRWTFEPARILGVPTDTRVEVPVRFRLKPN
jgi:protein TonB